MDTKYLDGQMMVKLVKNGAANLQKNAEIVNDLNVFPIPDGDTGLNMSMTISGGVAAAEGENAESLSEVSEKIAKGMLLSARGNSGVILSQLAAGIASGFNGVDKADVKTVAFALKSGVRRAYEAVNKPVEGTMLTVAREATEYACDKLKDDSTMESFFADFRAELDRSLNRTPDLLAVLKEAGVVDSGGAGLVYIADGMEKTLAGEELEAGAWSGAANAGHADFSNFNEDSELIYGYCTEFLLQLQNSKTDTQNFDVSCLTDWLEKIGDSIVAFKTGTVVKVHVHTKEPGRVLAYCQQYGEFLTLKIENMTLQHTEATIENRFTVKKEEVPKARKKYGVVTVASGKGITETFTNLGVDVVLEGGQTHNPSAADFIKAFDKTNADVIFVLPNNGNIIMAAQQAGEMYEGSEIRVVKSRSIGEGYAALSMLDFDSDDADEIESELVEAMSGVRSGQVSIAVRDAVIGGMEIKNNEYIGFSGKDMLATAPDRVDTVMELLTRLDAVNHDIIISIYGEGVPEEDKARCRAEAAKRFPRVDYCEIDGGQDVYDFLVVVE